MNTTQIEPNLEPDTDNPFVHRLVAKAQRRTGLKDLGPGSYLRYLERSVPDVENNGGLSRFGRFAYFENVVRCTAVRLRLVELAKSHPEILETPVTAPIFITGLYRSGTTLLHRLLAGSDDLRAPLFWELRCIDSEAPINKKRRTAAWSRRVHRILSPGFEDAHEILTDDPEECFHLFEHCAPTSPFWMTEAQDCAWEMISDDHRGEMVQAYEFLRLQLQVLQWRHPGLGAESPSAASHGGPTEPRRLILKWPFHLWNLDSLFEVFPDAQVLVCRRDLEPGGFERTVASTCSLAWHGQRPFCPNIDKERLGAFWLEFCSEGVRRAESARLKFGPQIHEVDFRELVAEPQEMASKICSGLEVAEPSSALRQRLEKRRRKHSYRLSDFGIDDAGS